MPQPLPVPDLLEPILEEEPPSRSRAEYGFWPHWLGKLEVGQAYVFPAEIEVALRTSASRVGKLMNRRFSVKLDPVFKSKVRCYRIA